MYRGSGVLVTEPSYYFPIIEDAREWGGIVCDDGMFIACDDEVKDHVIARSNLSSAVFGGIGQGISSIVKTTGYSTISQATKFNAVPKTIQKYFTTNNGQALSSSFAVSSLVSSISTFK